MLTRPEIYRVVNGYIGVSSGYLGDFSYKTHQEFYPYFCDLDIDPTEWQGTTKERFIAILEQVDAPTQAKILKGILSKYPVSYFPINERADKGKLVDNILDMINRLEGSLPIESPDLVTSSEVVERAIHDARTLIENSGATSGVDRIHTALHGYLKAICIKGSIAYATDASLTDLFKLLRRNHPALQVNTPRQGDIDKILRTISNILDALNPIRNHASVAHANEELLHEDEAMFVINCANTILYYLNAKFR